MEHLTTAAVCSDYRILQEIEEGHIIIHPFNQTQLNNCSYNLTLSEYFFREKPVQSVEGRLPLTFLNPWSEQQVGHRWQPGQVEIATMKTAEELGLSEGDKYITLFPMETILVATQEFVGTRGHLTGMIKGRSSCGRALLSICGGAGWGDVGFVNRWTLMITNNSRFATTVLPVGKSVAQIVFLEVGYPTQQYQGKYQHQVNETDDLAKFLADLKANWSPQMMLPQAYKDVSENSEEIKPTSYVSEHTVGD